MGWQRGEVVLTNLPDRSGAPDLAPWEARVLRVG